MFSVRNAATAARLMALQMFISEELEAITGDPNVKAVLVFEPSKGFCEPDADALTMATAHVGATGTVDLLERAIDMTEEAEDRRRTTEAAQMDSFVQSAAETVSRATGIPREVLLGRYPGAPFRFR